MPVKRTNRKTFASIGNVIDQVLRQHRPPSDQALIKVWDVWDQAVGTAIAANAKPAAFKGDMLLVHVGSSAWLHHLRFLEHEMVLNLNGLLGAERVRRIKFKIGTI